jgi:hypothetical protein
MKLTITVLFTVLCLLVVSCGDTGTPIDNNSTGSDTVTSVAETVTETEKILPDLPDNVDFGGHVFTILSNDYSIPIWSQRDIGAEAQNGELINDTVFERNSVISEKYNCSIAEIKHLDPAGQFRKYVTTGDATIDLATLHLNGFMSFAVEGLMIDYADIPYLDLTKPWWDPASVESLSLAGKLYAACSDLTIMDKDSTTAMIFNKKLTTDYSVENLYSLTERGGWTIDKLTELTKLSSSDVNGDGILDDNDNYGLLYQRDSLTSFMSGAGGFIAQKDSDDLPIITVNTLENVTLLEKLFAFMYNEEYCFHVMKFFDSKAEGFTNGMTRMFTNDQAMFMWIRLADVENLRAMETDFGILPIPKKDEQQTQYMQTVNPYVGTIIAFPQSLEDPERVGIFTEAISAESHYSLIPAYYEKLLLGKIARDEESLVTLDIIFNNRVYDIGDIYTFGGLAGTMITMTMTYDSNFTSKYAAAESKIQADIDKLITAFTS